MLHLKENQIKGTGGGVWVLQVLEQDQVLITLVVVVGPLQITGHLKSPVVVSIPHCGGNGLSQVLLPLLDYILHLEALVLAK